MRVLIAHNHYQQSGGEDGVVANERALLAAHGHEVVLHSVDNRTIQRTVDKIKVLVRTSYNDQARVSFGQRIAAVRPDVVHVHNFFPLLTPAIYDASREHGVPVVQTLHNYRLICAGALLLRNGVVCEKCVGRSPYWGVAHRCYRGSVPGSLAVAHMIDTHRRRGTWSRKVDRYIALTEFAKRKLVEGGLPGDRISIKANFAADLGEPAFAGRHGAFFAGRLSIEKGVRELIEAWKGLDYPLRVAGDGPLAEELYAKVSGNVTFLGWIDAAAIRREMAAAAFLVAPSTYYEAFPLTLAEAFASGLPAVVSGMGSPEEIVWHGETGIHVRPNDPQSLRAAVRDLIARPEKIERMGRFARKTYVMRYSPDVNYRELMAIYERALARTGRDRDVVT